MDICFLLASFVTVAFASVVLNNLIVPTLQKKLRVELKIDQILNRFYVNLFLPGIFFKVVVAVFSWT